MIPYPLEQCTLYKYFRVSYPSVQALENGCNLIPKILDEWCAVGVSCRESVAGVSESRVDCSEVT